MYIHSMRTLDIGLVTWILLQMFLARGLQLGKIGKVTNILYIKVIILCYASSDWTDYGECRHKYMHACLDMWLYVFVLECFLPALYAKLCKFETPEQTLSKNVSAWQNGSNKHLFQEKNSLTCGMIWKRAIVSCPILQWIKPVFIRKYLAFYFMKNKYGGLLCVVSFFLYVVCYNLRLIRLSQKFYWHCYVDCSFQINLFL